MPDPSTAGFGNLESELANLLNHLTSLKTEVESYKTATTTLQSNRDALQDNGARLVAAAEEGIKALQAATNSLQPLGTTEIKSDLIAMQAHIDSAIEKIAESTHDMRESTKRISDAASTVLEIPEAIQGKILGAIESNATQILSAIQETASDGRTYITQASGQIADQISSLDSRVQALEGKIDSHHAAVLDAVEHSSPISVIRKKRKP